MPFGGAPCFRCGGTLRREERHAQVATSCEFLLLRKKRALPAAHVVVDVDDAAGFGWVAPLREALRRAEAEDVRVYAVSRAKDR